MKKKKFLEILIPNIYLGIVSPKKEASQLYTESENRGVKKLKDGVIKLIRKLHIQNIGTIKKNCT